MKSHDLAVKTADGKLILVVEVKAVHGISSDWASNFRRNLIMHSWISSHYYFLLSTPKHLYLWKPSTLPSDEILAPDFTIDASVVFQKYVKGLNIPLENLGGESLEILTSSWLHDLTLTKSIESTPSSDWLLESGLLDALRNGSVMSESVA